MPRCLVIGLDCAPPVLVFDRYRDALPNLGGLMDRGLFGPLRSTEPPITVPAWASMTSGRDPGELGLYGFRNRVPGTYRLAVADARAMREKRLWDLIGDAGRRVAALFVPLTSPPSPVRGQMVSCFLTPGPDAPFAFPKALEGELTARFGPYEPDVPDFRTDDLARVRDDLFRTTAQHFAIARHVWEAHAPDFLMMVEMGTDRLHHAFWTHLDPTHPRHDPASPHREVGLDYYRFVDAQVGEMLGAAGPDTNVLVVSDHGARPMLGGVAINEWLQQEGYLTLAREPNRPEPLDQVGVAWAKTRAVGEGGYYARVFLNVRGRDPEGVIPPEHYEEERDRLAAALATIPGPDGRPLHNRVRTPEAAYRKVRGAAPDLLVYFGDLAYRALGTVGHGRIHLASNDTGPDGCNHDWDGILIAAGPSFPASGRVEGAQIYDIAPTVLAAMGVVCPPGLRGRSWVGGGTGG